VDTGGRNVTFGVVATSKKLLLPRSSFRVLLPVLIEDRSISASACESSGSSAVVMVAV
jgi:hypothetical protein